MKKRLLAFSIAAIIVVLAELIARYGLGLGDPPIAVGDAEIDYIFAPNQDCNRFGNRIVYNDASMRCDFDVLTGRAGEGIFVVGDSVVNGGVLTDHKDLATTILQEQFDQSRKNIQVCNVSAGSWGPGNYAAYLGKHNDLVGTNDIVVVEVNSHDLWEDDPTKAGGKMVGKDNFLIDHKPWCALWDGFDRYFIPRVRRWLGKAQVNTKIDVPKWEKDTESERAKYNLQMLDEIYALPWKKKFLLLWRSKQETVEDKETVGESVFRKYAISRDIPIIHISLSESDYRDTIHPSIQGQRKMAAAIRRALNEH